MTQTAQAPAQQQGLITRMAQEYGIEANTFKNTIVQTLFPSGKPPTNEQVAAFLVVADKYKLNPFIKEIYAFPGRSGGIVPIVSIDGWVTILNRQPAYDGVEFKENFADGKLFSVTAKVYRKDRSHPTVVTEYLSECKRNTDPWKMEARMLRHKALIQGARYAFGFAGIYDEDEAQRIMEAEGRNGSNDLAPTPIAVISQDQRTGIVDFAKANGVVESLGEIVNSFGFELIAHITVDRYEEVYEAIYKAAENAAKPVDAEYVEPIQGEVVLDEPTPEVAALNEVAKEAQPEESPLDPDEEGLREYVQSMFDELPKNRQKDFLAGRESIGKANMETLTKYKDELEDPKFA